LKSLLILDNKNSELNTGPVTVIVFMKPPYNIINEKPLVLQFASEEGPLILNNTETVLSH